MVSPIYRTPTHTPSSNTGAEPAGTSPGDLLILFAAWNDTNLYTMGLPANWNLIVSSPSEPSSISGWIIRGASAPSYTITTNGPASNIDVICVQAGAFDPITPITNINSIKTTSQAFSGSPVITGNSGDSFDAFINTSANGKTFGGNAITHTVLNNNSTPAMAEVYSIMPASNSFQFTWLGSCDARVIAFNIAQYTPPPPTSGNLTLLGVG